MNESRYVADELTHFVGANKRSDGERYEILKQILISGILMHPPFDEWQDGNLAVKTRASLCNNEMYDENVVCFCDIPFEAMEVHMRKYGRFAVAFRKSFLVERGASPVFYVSHNASARWQKENPTSADVRAMAEGDPARSLSARFDTSTRCEYFDDSIVALHRLLSDWLWLVSEQGGEASREKVSRIFRAQWFLGRYVFGFIKFFDDALADDHKDNYYMEREWRVVGAVRFNLTDVERVIVPEGYEARSAEDFSSYRGKLDVVSSVLPNT